MADERRQHNRVAVDWPARIGRKGLGVTAARIKDVSIGGVYVMTTLAVEVGENVLIELPTDANGGRRSLTHAKITRKDRGSDGRVFGYGVQFLTLDDDVLPYLLSVCVDA